MVLGKPLCGTPSHTLFSSNSSVIACTCMRKKMGQMGQSEAQETADLRCLPKLHVGGGLGGALSLAVSMPAGHLRVPGIHSWLWLLLASY